MKRTVTNFRDARHLLAALALTMASWSAAAAAPPAALPAGLERPRDARHEALRDLNSYFPFDPPKTEPQWARRAEEVRRRALVSQGLWPLPARTPLNAVVHGREQEAGYSIEKVYFEAAPGFYVTGSLYRPADDANTESPVKRRPGVLCPHGHWSNGRFTDAGQEAAEREVQSGAEESVEAGRSPLQARCVHLARLGCVVFHYDMIGYADSRQISFEIAHRFARQRPEMNDLHRWGLYSPQAESRLQSVMGLQTWSSIRALDFLETLPDVDSRRLAVTGASGGGTQSFMLAAIDPRLAAAFPAVMVSTAMQGGCTCENACLLRVGTGNVELAALFAPKPLGLTAADDWTKEMETKGFPQLQALYQMLGAPDRVALFANTQFKHNYNLVSRRAMYEWLNQHLQLGHEAPGVEREFARRTPDQLTVWDEAHPQPAGGDAVEHQVLRWWTGDTSRQLETLAAEDPELRGWRNVAGPGIDTVIGRELPAAAEMEFEQTGKRQGERWVEIAGLVRNKRRREESPAVFLYPKSWGGKVVIWLHPDGKSGLFTPAGEVGPPARQLLEADIAVVGVDLFLQGEHLAGAPAPGETRRVANSREAAAYTCGYNDSLFAQRVHDALNLVAFVRAHEYQPKSVALVGFDGTAGAWAAAARAQARGQIDQAAIHTRGFRFATVDDLRSPDFLPGGAKYDDLPGMLAAAGPAPLWLAGEPEGPPRIVRQAYQQKPSQLAESAAESDSKSLEDLLAWLAKGG